MVPSTHTHTNSQHRWTQLPQCIMGSLFFFLWFHSSSCCRFPIKIHVILANISFITFTFRSLSLGSHPPAASPPPPLPPHRLPTPPPALSAHLKSKEPCRCSESSSVWTPKGEWTSEAPRGRRGKWRPPESSEEEEEEEEHSAFIPLSHGGDWPVAPARVQPQDRRSLF